MTNDSTATRVRGRAAQSRDELPPPHFAVQALAPVIVTIETSTLEEVRHKLSALCHPGKIIRIICRHNRDRADEIRDFEVV
jgi:hypothetical protein